MVGLIGRCVYMVLCISCTYPPIATYEYTGSVDDLAVSLKKFAASNPEITFKFSRRDSTAQKDNGDRDLDIEFKRDSSIISYGLVCNQGQNTTEVELTSAFSHNNTYGGYGIKAPGVNKFLVYFEKDLLVRFKNQEHIDLVPK